MKSKVIIETRLCLELALSEEAVLKWEGRYGDNWIIFLSSGTKCDVVALRCLNRPEFSGGSIL
jgi:hypothetical protein